MGEVQAKAYERGRWRSLLIPKASHRQMNHQNCEGGSPKCRTSASSISATPSARRHPSRATPARSSPGRACPASVAAAAATQLRVVGRGYVARGVSDGGGGVGREVGDGDEAGEALGREGAEEAPEVKLWQ